jgi:hypothetical protein
MSSTGTTTVSSMRFGHRHRPGAAQEHGHLAHRPHRGRQPHPLGRARAVRGDAQRVEPLQRQRQVRAALVARHRVHLVHDDRFHAAQGLPGLRGKQQEQRLGRGDEDVGRLGDQLPAVLGRGVTGADRDLDVGLGQPQPVRRVPDPGQRGPQVPLDVHRQRLERGDVEHPGPSLRVLRRRHRRQLVDRPQERGQRLARSGRRDDQRVLALADGPPGSRLGLRRLGERPAEPGARGRREPVQRARGTGQRRLFCHAPILPCPTDISGHRTDQ